ncbi:MAG: hypothetical protein Ct9H300mP21_09600 [Pseudomonadota bacterium]|nr:MAG: hypothetical protein Ct9H300mP21_09600 [Pseudomonadota bacterium]
MVKILLNLQNSLQEDEADALPLLSHIPFWGLSLKQSLSLMRPETKHFYV